MKNCQWWYNGESKSRRNGSACRVSTRLIPQTEGKWQTSEGGSFFFQDDQRLHRRTKSDPWGLSVEMAFQRTTTRTTAR